MSFSVFVGNIDASIGAEDVAQHMSRAGAVGAVRMQRDKAGKPRPYCFVDFASEDAMLSVVRLLDGVELRG